MTYSEAAEVAADLVEALGDDGAEAIPETVHIDGGSVAAPAKGGTSGVATAGAFVIRGASVVSSAIQRTLDFATETANRWIEFNDIAPEEFNQELREAVSEVRDWAATGCASTTPSSTAAVPAAIRRQAAANRRARAGTPITVATGGGAATRDRSSDGPQTMDVDIGH